MVYSVSLESGISGRGSTSPCRVCRAEEAIGTRGLFLPHMLYGGAHSLQLEQTRGELKERPSTAAEDMVPRAEHEKQTSTLSQQLQQAEVHMLL